jgi:hypothetical protein
MPIVLAPRVLQASYSVVLLRDALVLYRLPLYYKGLSTTALVR